MKKVNNIMAYSSVFVILYRSVCLLFCRDLIWYHRNFQTLELIDFWFVVITFVHAYFNYWDYPTIAKKSIIAIMAVLLLTLFSPYIKSALYTYLYMYIVITLIIFQIKDLLQDDR